MVNTKKGTFKFVYFIYLCLLAVLCIAAVLSVNGLLREYENAQPEKKAYEAVETLKNDAESGKLWKNFAFPSLTVGKFEEKLDLKAEYVSLFASDDVKLTQKSGTTEENTLVYEVSTDGFIFAEVILKSVGDPITKLAVFTYQNWEIEKVTPIIEEHNFTLSVPVDFTVKVNGVALTEEDGEQTDGNSMDYTVSGVYLKPDFEISDTDGNVAKYAFKKDKVVPELYNYSLTLPSSLTLELNGEVHKGEELSDGRIKHDIRLLTKPTVKISDYYGNVLSYDGGNKLPLTYMTLTANDKYTVKVAGTSVPEAAITEKANAEYDDISEYVADLPSFKVYNIAILKDNVEIKILDENGTLVDYDKSLKTLDLTATVGLDSVPDEVASEIDVLDVAEKWSLFMSTDLAFHGIYSYLVPDSYQYKVALNYAYGIDITFTSPHTLLNPAFTDEKVTNFVWITEDCFSVDISFNKRMLLNSGSTVIDSMNDRFIFIKYDDPNNQYDKASWRLLSMKEIVTNAAE